MLFGERRNRGACREHYSVPIDYSTSRTHSSASLTGCAAEDAEYLLRGPSACRAEVRSTVRGNMRIGRRRFSLLLPASLPLLLQAFAAAAALNDEKAAFRQDQSSKAPAPFARSAADVPRRIRRLMAQGEEYQPARPASVIGENIEPTSAVDDLRASRPEPVSCFPFLPGSSASSGPLLILPEGAFASLFGRTGDICRRTR